MKRFHLLFLLLAAGIASVFLLEVIYEAVSIASLFRLIEIAAVLGLVWATGSYADVAQRTLSELKKRHEQERAERLVELGYGPLYRDVSLIRKQLGGQKATLRFQNLRPGEWENYSISAAFFQVSESIRGEAAILFTTLEKYNRLVSPAGKAGQDIVLEEAREMVGEETSRFQVGVRTPDGSETWPTFQDYLLRGQNPLQGEELKGSEILGFRYYSPKKSKDADFSPTDKEKAFSDLWKGVKKRASQDPHISELRQLFKQIDDRSESLLKKLKEDIQELRQPAR